MPYTNAKLYEELAFMAAINPTSQAVGTATSGWVPLAQVESVLAVIQVGVFGASATVDANLTQATSAAGAGAKAITGKALTQLLAAGGNNVQAAINCRGDELDVNNGFAFVQLNIIVGTAATLTAGLVIGGNLRNDPASIGVMDPASVVQLVP